MKIKFKITYNNENSETITIEGITILQCWVSLYPELGPKLKDVIRIEIDKN